MYDVRVMMLGENAIRVLLSMDDCIEAMETAFRAAHRGDFVQPLRLIAWQPDSRGAIAAMPAYLDGSLGAKLITVFPQNRTEGFDSHQGVIALHEARNGQLVCLAHAGAVTAIRTAAVSALATKLVANEGPQDLALLGSGVQAEEHLRAMACVRNLRGVRVWSRSVQNAEAFAKRHSSAGLDVRACETAQEAVRGAGIVCTVTAASQPVLQGAWLADGAHVNAVGSSVPPFRELDSEVVRRSKIYVDMRACVLRESDDILAPMREGIITEDDIAGDLPEMVSGSCALRTAREEITLFKSVGMAIEDLAAVRAVYERALSREDTVYVEL